MNTFSPFNQSLETSPKPTEYGKFQNSDLALLAQVIISGAGATPTVQQPQNIQAETLGGTNYVPNTTDVDAFSLNVPAESPGGYDIVMEAQNGQQTLRVEPGNSFSLQYLPGIRYRIIKIEPASGGIASFFSVNYF